MVTTRSAPSTILYAGLQVGGPLESCAPHDWGALTSEEIVMKGTYRVLALLVPIIVCFQAFVIGLEIFGLGSWVEDGNSFTKSVLESDSSPVTGAIGGALHGTGAIAMALVGLIVLIV